MVFELILAIFITRYLRKTFDTQVKLPQWDKILNALFGLAIALLVIQIAVHNLRVATTWVSHGLLLYIVYIIYKEKEFSAARPVLLTVAAYIILSMFEDILKLTDQNQYKAWTDLIRVGLIFSAIWMGTMW